MLDASRGSWKLEVGSRNDEIRNTQYATITTNAINVTMSPIFLIGVLPKLISSLCVPEGIVKLIKPVSG